MIRFADQATLYVEAGRGGKGCRSFYQDLWTRHPIPDGGDGGHGGHVFIRAYPQLTTLLDFQAQRHFRAGNGGNASSKKQHGSQGKDYVVGIPLGTVVSDADSGAHICEILSPGDEILLARGGAGGVGNASWSKWRSSRSMAQRRQMGDLPLEGAAGEKRKLKLELKLIADVGIIGLPNAGKSTLLGHISKAKPRVAAFPFTTTSPILGAVDLPEGAIIAVDVPGLIEGAHRGRGLGLDFLRHIERTKLLVHLIDMAGTEGRNPAEDYKTLQEELKAYSLGLDEKPKIIVANKMDCLEAKAHLENFRRRIKGEIVLISAMNGTGVNTLLKKISQKLKKRHGINEKTG